MVHGQMNMRRFFSICGIRNSCTPKGMTNNMFVSKWVPVVGFGLPILIGLLVGSIIFQSIGFISAIIFGIISVILVFIFPGAFILATGIYGGPSYADKKGNLIGELPDFADDLYRKKTK